MPRVMIDLDIPTHEFDNFEELCDAQGVENADDLLEALKNYYDQDLDEGYGLGEFINDCGLLEGASVSITVVSEGNPSGKPGTRQPTWTSARWGELISTVASTVTN